MISSIYFFWQLPAFHQSKSKDQDLCEIILAPAASLVSTCFWRCTRFFINLSLNSSNSPSMAARRLGGLRIIRFGNPGKNALAFTLGYLGVEDHGSMFSSCFFFKPFAANLSNRSNDTFGTQKRNAGEDLHSKKNRLTTRKMKYDVWYGFWCPFQECCLIISNILDLPTWW